MPAVHAEVRVGRARRDGLLGLQAPVATVKRPRPDPVGAPNVRGTRQIAEQPNRRPQTTNQAVARQFATHFYDAASPTKLAGGGRYREKKFQKSAHETHTRKKANCISLLVKLDMHTRHSF